ncbi:hypothetical protein [Scleromatobacter humisilvae]|uniref:Uncharacterized protein n=1 Tax=Scleromatobacter humisilvae TaxID=2897159 RepID=A0A9X1YKW6_9BURK|nr:hypothetical protein [Scleromatobacter humisilvae]MCK9687330.1 hypothetical protein [Scleromatobacter humisilvae]
MKKLEWQPVVLANALDVEHGDTHAQLAIDRPRREVILKMDVYDIQAVWDFVRGPLLSEFDDRVFDVRDYGGVHALANHTLAIQLAGTLFPVPFYAHDNGSVSSMLGNPRVERQRRCDESRLGVMQALKGGGYRAALLAEYTDEGWPALHVLVDYKLPRLSFVFELGDLAQTGAYFDVPVDVEAVTGGLFKLEHAVQLLSQGYSALSEDGTRLESSDGSPDEVARWLGSERGRLE